MNKKELWILRGLPGSGKSTVAKSLNALHFEADMYHVDANGVYNWKAENIKKSHAWCKESVEASMIGSKDNPMFERIAVSNTSTQEWEIKPYLELAEKYGYRVYSLVVENRHGGENEHAVPEETIDKMRERFEVIL